MRRRIKSWWGWLGIVAAVFCFIISAPLFLAGMFYPPMYVPIIALWVIALLLIYISTEPENKE
jgi:hypothetical protein